MDGLRHVDLSGVRDEHLVAGRGPVELLDLPHDVQTGGDLAEDHVAAVQPAGLDGADEELAPVGVGAGAADGFGGRAGNGEARERWRKRGRGFDGK